MRKRLCLLFMLLTLVGFVAAGCTGASEKVTITLDVTSKEITLSTNETDNVFNVEATIDSTKDTSVFAVIENEGVLALIGKNVSGKKVTLTFKALKSGTSKVTIKSGVNSNVSASFNCTVYDHITSIQSRVSDAKWVVIGDANACINVNSDLIITPISGSTSELRFEILSSTAQNVTINQNTGAITTDNSTTEGYINVRVYSIRSSEDNPIEATIRVNLIKQIQKGNVTLEATVNDNTFVITENGAPITLIKNIEPHSSAILSANVSGTAFDVEMTASNSTSALNLIQTSSLEYRINAINLTDTTYLNVSIIQKGALSYVEPVEFSVPIKIIDAPSEIKVTSADMIKNDNNSIINVLDYYDTNVKLGAPITFSFIPNTILDENSLIKVFLEKQSDYGNIEFVTQNGFPVEIIEGETDEVNGNSYNYFIVSAGQTIYARAKSNATLNECTLHARSVFTEDLEIGLGTGRKYLTESTVTLSIKNGITGFEFAQTDQNISYMLGSEPQTLKVNITPKTAYFEDCTYEIVGDAIEATHSFNKLDGTIDFTISPVNKGKATLIVHRNNGSSISKQIEVKAPLQNLELSIDSPSKNAFVAQITTTTYNGGTIDAAVVTTGKTIEVYTNYGDATTSSVEYNCSDQNVLSNSKNKVTIRQITNDYVYFTVTVKGYDEYGNNKTLSKTIAFKGYQPISSISLNVTSGELLDINTVGYFNKALAQTTLKVNVYPLNATSAKNINWTIYDLSFDGVTAGKLEQVTEGDNLTRRLTAGNKNSNPTETLCVEAYVTDFNSVTYSTKAKFTVKKAKLVNQIVLENVTDVFECTDQNIKELEDAGYNNLNTLKKYDSLPSVIFNNNLTSFQVKSSAYPLDANNTRLRYSVIALNTTGNNVFSVDAFGKITPISAGKAILRISAEDHFNNVNESTLYTDVLVEVNDGSSHLNAILISSSAELIALGTETTAKFYKLKNNIDLGAISNFNAIGGSNGKFAGSLNGNGKTIYNLTINDSATASKNYGLFNEIVASSLGDNVNSIENLNIIVKSIKINYSKCTSNVNLVNIGALAGINSGIICNVTVEFKQNTYYTSGYNHANIGGMVGYNSGTITFAGLTSTQIGVSGGGIVVTNDTTNAFYNFGGVVGSNYGGSITGNYEPSNIDEDSYSFYQNEGMTSTIQINSYNTYYDLNDNTSNAVTLNSRIGGLVGYSVDGSLTNCAVDSLVYGQICVGGLIGETTNATEINNCYFAGRAHGNTYVGGIIGKANGATLTGCNVEMYDDGQSVGKNAISILAIACAGGLVGSATNCTFDSCNVISYVTRQLDTTADYCTTTDKFNGDVVQINSEGDQGSYVGSVVGNEYNEGNDNKTTYTNCTSNARAVYLKNKKLSTFVGNNASVSGIENATNVVPNKIEVNFENASTVLNASGTNILILFYANSNINYKISDLIQTSAYNETNLIQKPFRYVVTSSNPTIATILNNGCIEVKSTGIATITISLKQNLNIKQSFIVYCTQAVDKVNIYSTNASDITSPVVNNSTIYVRVGEYKNLNPVFYQKDANGKLVVSNNALVGIKYTFSNGKNINGENYFELVNANNINNDYYINSNMFTTIYGKEVSGIIPITATPYVMVDYNNNIYYYELKSEQKTFNVKVYRGATAMDFTSSKAVEVESGTTVKNGVTVITDADFETLTVTIKDNNNTELFTENLEGAISKSSNNGAFEFSCDGGKFNENIYNLNFAIKQVDNYRYITKPVTYYVTFTSNTNKQVHETFEVVFKPAEVSVVNVNTFTYAQLDVNEEYNPNEDEGNKLVPGYENLSKISITPPYAYYDYITVTSNKEGLGFTQYLRQNPSSDSSNGYPYKAIKTTWLNNGIILSNNYYGEENNLISADKQYSNKAARYGNYFVGIKMANTNAFKENEEVPITITFYTINEENKHEQVYSYTYSLFATYTSHITLTAENVYKYKDTNYISWTTENTINYYVENNDSTPEVTFNYNGESELNSYNDYENDYLKITNINTQNNKITFSITSKNNGVLYGNELTVTVTSKKVIDGREYVAAASITFTMVDFIVTGINLGINLSENPDVTYGENPDVTYGNTYELSITKVTAHGTLKDDYINSKKSGNWYGYNNNNVLTLIENTDSNKFKNKYYEAVSNNSIKIIKIDKEESIQKTIVYNLPGGLDPDNHCLVIPNATEENVLQASLKLKTSVNYNTEGFIAIQSESDFYAMQPGNKYILTEDIELKELKPIEAEIARFNGNYHTITISGFAPLEDNNNNSNENEDSSEKTLTYALFKTLAKNSIIENLNVNISADLYLDATAYSTITFGALVGENNGKIFNCALDYKKETTKNTVNESASVSTVIGGVRVSHSYAYLNAINLADSSKNNIIIDKDKSKCLTVQITASKDEGKSAACTIGCLVGVNNSTGYITNCRVNSGVELYGFGVMGGLVGNNAGTIASSYTKAKLNNYTSVTTEGGVGGFVSINSGTISLSYADGKYLSDNDNTSRSKISTEINASAAMVGGFVNSNSGTISDCYSNIKLVSESSSAGFVMQNSGNIKNCYSSSLVKENNEHAMAFLGNDINNENSNGKITNCYFLLGSYPGIDKQPATSISEKEFNNASSFAGFAFDYVYDNNKWSQNQAGKDAVWVIEANAKKPTITSANMVYSGESITITGSEYDENNQLKFTFSSYNGLGASEKFPYVIYNSNDFNGYITNNDDYITNNDVYITNNDDYIKDNGDKYFVLACDIDFHSVEDNEIYNKVETYKTEFTGNLQGNNMTINNIRINTNQFTTNENGTSMGIFSGVNGGVIKNLNLSINHVYGTKVNTVGSLAGIISNKSKIYNVEVTGTGHIEGQNITGGLAGVVQDSIIVDCATSVGVTSGYYKVISSNNLVSLLNKNETQISDNKLNYAGGFAGVAIGNSYISNCEVTNGAITIGTIAGGAFGCLGTSATAEFINSTVSEGMYVQSAFLAGGLVGELRGTLNASSVHYNDDITTSVYKNSKQGVLSNDVVTNYLRSSSTDEHTTLGGVVALNNGGKLTACYSTIDIVEPKAVTAGGLIGWSLRGTVDACYASGSIYIAYMGSDVASKNQGINYKIVGGLVGKVTNAISNFITGSKMEYKCDDGSFLFIDLNDNTINDNNNNTVTNAELKDCILYSGNYYQKTTENNKIVYKLVGTNDPENYLYFNNNNELYNNLTKQKIDKNNYTFEQCIVDNNKVYKFNGYTSDYLQLLSSDTKLTIKNSIAANNWDNSNYSYYHNANNFYNYILGGFIGSTTSSDLLTLSNNYANNSYYKTKNGSIETSDSYENIYSIGSSNIMDERDELFVLNSLEQNGNVVGGKNVDNITNFNYMRLMYLGKEVTDQNNNKVYSDWESDQSIEEITNINEVAKNNFEGKNAVYSSKRNLVWSYPLATYFKFTDNSLTPVFKNKSKVASVLNSKELPLEDVGIKLSLEDIGIKNNNVDINNVTDLEAYNYLLTTNELKIDGIDKVTLNITNNLDFLSYVIDNGYWSGVGYRAGKIQNFKGNLNGNNHTISNFITNVGLFCSTEKATIQAVGFDNTCEVIGSNNVSHAGMLIATDYLSNISNCYSSGSYSGNSSTIGGLIGLAMGSTIDNVYTNSTVSASNFGGIVGDSIGAKISHWYAIANRENDSVQFGGACSSASSNADKTGITDGFALVGDSLTKDYAVTEYNNSSNLEVSNVYCSTSNIKDKDKVAKMDPNVFKIDAFFTNSKYWNKAWDSKVWTFSSVSEDINDRKYPTLTGLGTQNEEQTVIVGEITLISLNGSLVNGYYLNNGDDLLLLAKKINNGEIKNGGDGMIFILNPDKTEFKIDSNFTPIGTIDHPFRGKFYGMGKTININVSEFSGNEFGLFGAIKDNAYVCDLTVNYNVTTENTNGTVETGVTITASEGSVYVGGIAGSVVRSTIQGCIVNGSINVQAEDASNVYIGGIAGYVNSSLIDSNAFQGKLGYNKTNASIGGIIGYLCAQNVNISNNCVNSSTISVTNTTGNNYVGILFGRIRREDNSINNVTNNYYINNDTESNLGIYGKFENKTSNLSADNCKVNELSAPSYIHEIEISKTNAYLASTTIYTVNYDLKDNKLSLTRTPDSNNGKNVLFDIFNDVPYTDYKQGGSSSDLKVNTDDEKTFYYNIQSGQKLVNTSNIDEGINYLSIMFNAVLNSGVTGEIYSLTDGTVTIKINISQENILTLTYNDGTDKGELSGDISKLLSINSDNNNIITINANIALYINNNKLVLNINPETDNTNIFDNNTNAFDRKFITNNSVTSTFGKTSEENTTEGNTSEGIELKVYNYYLRVGKTGSDVGLTDVTGFDGTIQVETPSGNS